MQKGKLNEIKIEIERQRSEYENMMFGQKERIFSLREENRKLKEELETYKRKDAQISSALLSALQKAREIEDTAKLRSEMDLLRLKEFHARWMRYYEEVKKLFPKDANLKAAGRFLAKMDAILTGEPEKKQAVLKGEQTAAKGEEAALMKELESGKERISAAITENRKIDSAAAFEKPDEDDLFDLDNLLNTQSLQSLDELCKEMGLMEDGK